jgi:hypothetical protein
MDKDRLKTSNPLSSGDMTNCITQHGEWRLRHHMVEGIGFLPNGELCAEFMAMIGVRLHRLWKVKACDIKFYYPDGTYTGFRLKQLK